MSTSIPVPISAPDCTPISAPDRAPFHDPAGFPGVVALAEHWREIHAEFLAVQHERIDYVERHLYDQGWQVFGLWNLPHREPLAGAAQRCPVTASLIERHLPTHGAVAFSILAPGTHILPHRGWQGRTLRAHIGLEVPAGDCAIRVADQTRGWTEGQALVLDDRLEHEAWNRTAQRRVVLLFDFEP